MTATSKNTVMKEQRPLVLKGESSNNRNFSAAASMLATLLLAPLAFALPAGLGSIESKADEIRILVVAVTAIIVVIGALELMNVLRTRRKKLRQWTENRLYNMRDNGTCNLRHL